MELTIYDYLDETFLKSLGEVKDQDVKIRINSWGGDLFVGLACYNILKSKNAYCVVEGVCASAATLLVCGATASQMYDNSYLVIHNPWSVVIGDYKDFVKYSSVLSELTDTVASIYAAKSQRNGKDVSADEFRLMMEEETWINASDAVEYGLVDSVIKTEPDRDYSVSNQIGKYKNVPKNLLAKYYQQIRKSVEW